LAGRQRFDLRAQGGEGVAPLAFHRRHLALGLLESGADRLHQLRQRGLALAQRAFHARLLAAETLARETQEVVAVVAQRLLREIVHRGAQPQLRCLEEFRSWRCAAVRSST
jgi:hypothetical protein